MSSKRDNLDDNGVFRIKETAKKSPREKTRFLTGDDVLSRPKKEFSATSYNSVGLETGDENQAVCRLEVSGTKRSYFIKVSGGWVDGGSLFDPNSVTGHPSSKRETSRFSFRPVTQRAFDGYLAYLRTKDRRYYEQASKEVLNAGV